MRLKSYRGYKSKRIWLKSNRNNMTYRSPSLFSPHILDLRGSKPKRYGRGFYAYDNYPTDIILK